MNPQLKYLNRYRLPGSDPSFGPYGAFMLEQGHIALCIIAAGGDETGWEHVSVHAREKRNRKEKLRTPTWEEMCKVKDLFWAKDECVVQFHVPASDHINVHPHVLHLWRSVQDPFPLPPRICV